MRRALPDLVVEASDGTRFHVHTDTLTQSSNNSFDGLLPSTHGSLTLSESPEVLDIALHILYEKAFSAPLPRLNILEDALEALVKYGAHLPILAAPPLPLYALLLQHAPSSQIETYALAAHYDLEDAAVAISAHLLAYDITELSDELSLKMGPIYMMRLVELQQLRLSALKAIVLTPPVSHLATATCGSGPELSQAWALAAIPLIWEARPSECRIQR